MKLQPGILIGIGIVAAIIIGSLLVAQGQIGLPGIGLSGKIISETREVANFNKISIAGSGTAVVEQGEEESLTVEADEKLMRYISSEVVSNELQIGVEYPSSSPTLLAHEIKYHIKVKDIEKISLSGSVKLEGSGITTDELELGISGSGTFKLAGTADKQKIFIDGSGNFFGQELKGKEGEVSIAGSGKVEVNVSDKLDVDISGSGVIRYLGDPELGETNVSGSGKIEKIE